MGCLIGGIRHHCFHLWKRLNQFVVNIVKRHAVMDISGGNHCFQYVTVLVTGGMGLISKAPPVFPFMEYSTLRVCGGYRYCFLLFSRFLPPVNANRKMSFFAGMECHLLAVSMRWVCSLDYPLFVGLKPVKS